MSVEYGARKLNKYVRHYMFHKSSYSQFDDKDAHVIFKNYIGTHFIKSHNLEKEEMLQFDLHHRTPKHLRKVKDMLRELLTLQHYTVKDFP